MTSDNNIQIYEFDIKLVLYSSIQLNWYLFVFVVSKAPAMI